MTTEQRLVQPPHPLPATDLTVEWAVEHDGIVYRRPQATDGEHHHLVTLQGAIWDPEVATPAHQLIAAESCGGIVLGAFHAEQAVGLSYAFPAHRDRTVWLHSHQTGVQDGSRDHGVGATLKWLQRWLALQEGYAVITWTFDPLQSRNAYFNFSKLGVVARTYKVDCYGRLPDPSNRDLPTDRLWVEWHLDSRAVTDRFARYRAASGIQWPALAGSRVAASDPLAPPLTDGMRRALDTPEILPTRGWGQGGRIPADTPSLDGEPRTLRLEVPDDLDLVRKHQGAAGMSAWRLAVRRAFTAAFERGYLASGFVTTPTRDGRRSWYVLTRPDD